MARLLVGALLLVAAAPATLAQQHIYTGKTSPAPVKYGSEPGWYHVVAYRDGVHGIAVAATQETLLAGGGDRLDPGSSLDLYGEGVWLAGPKTSGRAVVSIELRERQTYIHVDPLGQYQTISANKAAQTRVLPRNQWVNIACTVAGMIAYDLRAEGGTVWVGTHVDQSQPPNTQPDSAGAWPLFPDDPPYRLSGNPCLFVYTFDLGTRLHFIKHARGREFVTSP
jgi:hypothetical protein